MATRTAITTVTSAGPGVTSIATAAYNQPSGETITLRVAFESDSGTAVTVSAADTAGNSFTVKVQGTTATSTNLQYVALLRCIGATANASNVITVTLTGNTGQKVVLMGTRYATAGIIADKAVSAVASGNSTAPATAAISAGDFAEAIFKHWSHGAFTAGSGWTSDYSDPTNFEASAEYRQDSPGGTYTASGSIVGADVWTGAAFSFSEFLSPIITAQPGSAMVVDGGTATFSVTASASAGSLTYQWQSDTGGGFSNISGETSSSYTTGTLGLSDNYNHYRCNVTDSNGTTTTATADLYVYSSITSGKGREHLGWLSK